MLSAIIIYKNKKASININFTNPDTGLPVDLTGLRFEFFAKHNYNDPDTSAVVHKSTGPIVTGITKVDPKNGWARIDFLPQDTVALPVPTVLGYKIDVFDFRGRTLTVAVNTLQIISGSDND